MNTNTSQPHDAWYLDSFLLQEIEKDICLLYKQLSEYSYIMGDLDWTRTFPKPYWEYVDIPLSNFDEERKNFIQSGCLVMILTMAWDKIDGSGTYIEDKIELIHRVIETANIADEKLKKTVLLALKIAKKTPLPEEELTELKTLSLWVHKKYVQGYFSNKVK